MILDKHTTVHVIDKRTGDVSTSSLDGWFLSIKGGSHWDDYEITTDKAEADAISGKYKRIAKIVQRLNQLVLNTTRMGPDLACQTVDDFSAILDHIIEKSRARVND